MNALSGKVLQKVLTGFIITEPDMRCSEIKKRCLGTKRVPGLSRFSLRCHRTTNERERERERERRTNRKVPNNSISKYREMKVCMHEKCMNM